MHLSAEAQARGVLGAAAHPPGKSVISPQLYTLLVADNNNIPRGLGCLNMLGCKVDMSSFFQAADMRQSAE